MNNNVLNCEQIKTNLHKITMIGPLINQHEWKYITLSLHTKDWKTFETNNKSIALNV